AVNVAMIPMTIRMVAVLPVSFMRSPPCDEPDYKRQFTCSQRKGELGHGGKPDLQCDHVSRVAPRDSFPAARSELQRSRSWNRMESWPTTNETNESRPDLARPRKTGVQRGEQVYYRLLPPQEVTRAHPCRFPRGP